jgi:hypothetical protein
LTVMARAEALQPTLTASRSPSGRSWLLTAPQRTQNPRNATQIVPGILLVADSPAFASFYR